MTFKPAAWPRKLRSQEWFGGTTKDAIYHRGWMKNQGFPPDLFDGRPVIGILNTWSELTPCNAHLNDLAQRVKHGIYEAGGFPCRSACVQRVESALRPTAMMFRNLAAMQVEEAMRGQPMDGCVLMVGCDKTTPSLLMAAASTDIPSIVVTGGPMLNGYYKNERVGSGTHLWKFSAAVAGDHDREEFVEAEASMSRSPGSCNTMGTASTMASMAEALGMALSGNAAIPAVDSRRRVMAQMTGRRIVQMVKDDLKPSDILKKEAFENAIRTNAAIGGSTNAVIHLLAIAGRVGVDLTLDDWDRCGRDVPTIVNLMPSGKYLMEEFFYAGGLPVVIKRLGEAGVLHRDALTVSGEGIWDQVKDVENHNPDVILPAEKRPDAIGRHCGAEGQSCPQGRGFETLCRNACLDGASGPRRRVRGHRRL
jgi:L-arabonate dehydrase